MKMTSVLQQKKKKKVTYNYLFEWAKKELEKNDSVYLKKKSKIINELADKLSKIEGIELQKISTMISKELKDVVTATYVADTLPPEYKNKTKIDNRKGKGKTGGIRSDFRTKQALPPLETEEDTEVIWQIKPEDYRTEDLEKYDRNTLTKIIKWYEVQQDKQLKESFRWDNISRELKQKIKDLESEIKALKTGKNQ